MPQVKENEKKALLIALGGLGIIVLLIGMVFESIDLKVMFIIAVGLWIITAVMGSWLEVKGKKKE